MTVTGSPAFAAMTTSLVARTSQPEQAAGARLDLVAHLLDGGGVLLEGFDLAERLAPGLLFGERMHRAQPTHIHHELLALRREAVALEQPCRVRIRRRLEDAVRPDHHRHAFRGVDDLDRLAGLLQLEQVVLVAVSLDRALAELELL